MFFAQYLARFIEGVHQFDQDFELAAAIPETYNPESGVAYYVMQGV